PRVAPTPGNLGCTASEILDVQQLESSLFKQPFVLSRRYEKIEPNRTAYGELLMRHRPCNNHRIGEQGPRAGTQDAMPLTQNGEPPIDMTHRIVRQNGVKTRCRKRQ